MNILCIDMNVLLPLFQSLGHTAVGLLQSDISPVVNVPGLVQKYGIKPDLILQGEHLGRRILLEGLEEIDCPKVFWAVDSHLNMFWHCYYARMFTALLTPHLSMWQALPPEFRHPLVRQMAKYGQDIPWIPHAERQYNICFVGVVDRHRALRRNLIELLETHWKVEKRQGIPFAEMMELYSDSRIIPNEAIAFEVNYRLMEGASCGSVVLSQHVGADQDSLFERDREILVYRHAAELIEQISRILANPGEAEKIGYAAWQRVQAEHLPVHRAKFILDLAEKLLRGREPEEILPDIDASYVRRAFWLARVQTKRASVSGQIQMPLPEISQQKICTSAETAACTLQLFVENHQNSKALELVQMLLVKSLYADNLDVNLAASFAGLRLHNFDLAKQFFYRQIQFSKNIKILSCPGDLCLQWAKLLIREKRYFQSGFPFDPDFHLPGAAREVLMLAEVRYGKQISELELVRTYIRALAYSNTMIFFKRGYAARLSLLDSENWRAQFDYGMLSLQCYCLKEGLFELEQARLKAVQQGEGKSFERLLEANDPGGSIARLLDR